jgi:probable F420-dependent oxidoreductase
VPGAYDADRDDRREIPRKALMRVGMHALGIGPGSHRALVRAVATGAERVGVATLWAGEHVVMFDEQASRYPYSGDGRIAVPADAEWLDPFVCLSFAAAVTSRINLATGVLLLPEHNPVIVAKRAASLDRISGGRFLLGVGIGWSAEEFEALGVPFAGRAARTVEYLEAIRQIWREDPASFHGEHVAFDRVRVHPKPLRDRGIPVFFGGNSDPALTRAAAHGDGWYGFNLDGVDAVRERVGVLRRACDEQHRAGAPPTVAVAVAGCTPRDLAELAAIGVDEVVLVDAPPERADQVDAWLSQRAGGWLAALKG